MPSAKAKAGNGRRSIIITTASVVFAALRRFGASLAPGADPRTFCRGVVRAWEAAMRTTYTNRLT
jgi:hypothetical protein